MPGRRLITLYLAACLLVVPEASLAAAGQTAAFPATLHHRITARLSPEAHRIELDDEIRFAGERPSAAELRFGLDAGLRAESLDPAFVVESLRTGTDQATDGLRLWRLRPARGSQTIPADLRLRISGEIYHPPQTEAEEYARGFSRTRGTIQAEGVLLSGATGWIPVFRKELLTFDIEVTVPGDWDVLSQGRRVSHERSNASRGVRWHCDRPMDEVYLVAGPFTEYRASAGRTRLYAFLRQADPDLAQRYFEATESYLAMYQELIGAYPYEKFALVENFWETGYGMPSFTLLGSKVIRFPFILHSSYPHEILHNWWGNSVYVAADAGNWSEGLTAYLADHLIKEGRGRGVEYRRDTLARYRSYVREERDFALKEFRARHSASTEAVGYGKSLMLWHMLRRRIGDVAFRDGLREAYRRLRFRRSSFRDFATIFSDVAGEDLRPFFEQWVDRTGAPELSLDCAMHGGDRVRLSLRQEQPEAVYDLLVPVALTLEGKKRAEQVSLTLDRRERDFELDVSAPVVRADLDPAFDLFRRLASGEVPLTLADLFGAAPLTIVLPRKASRAFHAAWKELAQSWARQAAAAVDIVEDDALENLPAEGAIWLLGATNRWAGLLDVWLEARGGGRCGEGGLRLAGQCYRFSDHSTVIAGRTRGGSSVVGWVAGSSPAAIAGLARKLPHYGRYSYLAFRGDEPTNVAKGQWQALASPLARTCGERAGDFPARGELSAREPLTRPAARFDPARLAEHVAFLAADALEGRGLGSPGLVRAADYIAAAFRRAGLEPGGDDGSFYQDWREKGGPRGETISLRNVVGVLPGKRSDWQGQSLVVGAHYDHLGRGWPDHHKGDEGKIHNGADDNASGVAVLLELAQALGRSPKPDRSIVFVAFSGEEWGRRGSQHYLQGPSDRTSALDLRAMINLDTVGRMNSGGLLMLGAGSASEWPQIAMGVGFTTGIDAKAVQNDPGGSDQKSFLDRGIPAIQLFTGASADYHRPSDDAGKVDVEGLAKIATYAREIIVYLAAREEPLHASLSPDHSGSRDESPPATERRRVRLGTVPDYGYDGVGVRIAEVVAGSPADRAGIAAGDIVTSIGDAPVSDLKSFAAQLRRHRAGDRIRLTLLRGRQTISLEAALEER